MNETVFVKRFARMRTSGAGVVRPRFEAALGRLRARGWPILQTAVAASLAWTLATMVLGHERPFFAAIAAVVSLGVAVGKEGRQAAELVFGVACGLAVADLIVAVIGTGPVQIAVVVALAMGAAVLLNGATLLVTEAGVTALFTVMLDPSTYGTSPERFVDALVGSGVALAITAIFPNSPRHIVERAAHPIFGELASVLEETKAALLAGDLGMAERALDRARMMDVRVGELKEAIDAGYKTIRISPPRRRDLMHLGHYATAADQLDLAVRNTRVLARAAVNMVREDRETPERLAETISDLARAVEALGGYLESPDHPPHTRRLALRAAEEATTVLEERHDLETSVLVGQVQCTAVDLLRASGMDPDTSLRAFREAATHAPDRTVPVG